MPNRSQQSGLTLVELMVVIAILGIVAAVAWPAYERQMASQRRAEALRVLSMASNALERCYADTADYTGCSVSASISGSLVYYTLSPTTPTNASSYTLTAAPKAGTSQAGDECGSLTLNHLGQKGRSGTAPLKRCWSE